MATYLAKGMGLFVDIDIEAATDESNGKDDTGDATADDGDCWIFCSHFAANKTVIRYEKRLRWKNNCFAPLHHLYVCLNCHRETAA